jgi:hypothetical protein
VRREAGPVTAGRDAVREQLAALLITLWEEDAGEPLDGIDGVSESVDAYLERLLPVVDRIANERAAAELRAAGCAGFFTRDGQAWAADRVDALDGTM